MRKAIKPLERDAENKFARYTYASTDTFFEMLGPVMAEANLVLLTDELEHEIITTESRKDSVWLRVKFGIVFMSSETGEISPPFKRSIALPHNGAQTYGAAQSYIIKQFLRGIFLVPTGDETEEADSQPHAVPPSQQTPRNEPQHLEVARKLKKALQDAQTLEDLDMIVNSPDMESVMKASMSSYDYLMDIANQRSEDL